MAKALAAGLAVLAAGLIIAWRAGALSYDDATSLRAPAPVQRDATPKARAPTELASSQSPGTRWASDVRAVRIAAMRTAADVAPDLRAFFHRALGDPGDGGIYYAARVLADCVSLNTARNAPPATKVGSGTEEQLAGSVAALDQAIARCDGLGDDASKATLAAALNAGAFDDPFQGMILRERAARAPDGNITFDAASAMVQQAIVLGDPNFLVESLRRLDGVAEGFDELELQAHDANGFRGLLDIVAIEARCALGVDCAREAAAIMLCYRGACGPYVERLGIQAGFTDDEKRFIVQAAADVAAAARDGTLLGRYRR